MVDWADLIAYVVINVIIQKVFSMSRTPTALINKGFSFNFK